MSILVRCFFVYWLLTLSIMNVLISQNHENFRIVLYPFYRHITVKIFYFYSQLIHIVKVGIF